MANMREIEDQIAAELTYLGETYPPEMAIKVLELTQKEIHHREKMIVLYEIADKLGKLIK